MRKLNLLLSVILIALAVTSYVITKKKQDRIDYLERRLHNSELNLLYERNVK